MDILTNHQAQLLVRARLSACSKRPNLHQQPQATHLIYLQPCKQNPNPTQSPTDLRPGQARWGGGHTTRLYSCERAMLDKARRMGLGEENPALPSPSVSHNK